MALPCVRLRAVTCRTGSLLRYLSGSVKPQDDAGCEDLVLPKKKTWDKTAVLQALAYTVNHDPTSSHYLFHDDPYLVPRTALENRIYLLSRESGRNAAKYVFDTYPNNFTKDIAEPHIPCLMPETLQPLIEGLSEEALNERIRLRRVKESVDLYDQLLQGGVTPSIETSNRLLDLLCFYGDREPEELKRSQLESENEEEMKRRPGWKKKYGENILPWRQNSHAERIFNLMPERDAHTFCTMIRGMVKYGAAAKAFGLYTDLLNNRMSADVHTFNALITAVHLLKETSSEKLDFMMELMRQMVQQKVQPNLLTFNTVLNSMRNCGGLAKGPAMHTLSEMKALNIEPSMATYFHFLGVFYKTATFGRGTVDLFEEMLNEMKGKSFVAQDPDDVYFFASAMQLCLDLKDLELAYKLWDILETGDNWKLLGNLSLQHAYYGRFFKLLCMMENIDVILKWYRAFVPSRFYPNHLAMLALLQALEMESCWDLIPEIWKDVKQLGLRNKVELVEKVLSLMAKQVQPPELQNTFAKTALDIKSMYDIRDPSRVTREWSATALGDVAILLARAGRTDEAWKSFKIFQTENLVPSSAVIDVLLHAAKTAGNASLAVDLVQQAVSFSLPNTSSIARRVTEEFSITEEQRITLEDVQTESSSSSESSDEDWERK